MFWSQIQIVMLEHLFFVVGNLLYMKRSLDHESILYIMTFNVQYYISVLSVESLSDADSSDSNNNHLKQQRELSEGQQGDKGNSYVIASFTADISYHFSSYTVNNVLNIMTSCDHEMKVTIAKS